MRVIRVASLRRWDDDAPRLAVSDSLDRCCRRECFCASSGKKGQDGHPVHQHRLLAFSYPPFHKGFYRDQGIELETIFMATQGVNAAFVRGDLDYSAAVNGIIQGIGRGAAAKILACAVDRRLQSFIAVFLKKLDAN